MKRYASIISNEEVQVSTYYVEISLGRVEGEERYRYFNNIPTDLTLEEDQVDALISESIHQLEANQVFSQFLLDIQSDD